MIGFHWHPRLIKVEGHFMKLKGSTFRSLLFRSEGRFAHSCQALKLRRRGHDRFSLASAPNQGGGTFYETERIYFPLPAVQIGGQIRTFVPSAETPPAGP